MQSVTFQVPGKPQGKARAKTVRNKSTGNIHSYTPEKDMLYENYIKDSERGPHFKLVEADGGLWKNVTMKKIKEYLEFELAEELKEHHITVIA